MKIFKPAQKILCLQKGFVSPVLILIFVGVFLALLGGGYWYFSRYSQAVTEKAETKKELKVVSFGQGVPYLAISYLAHIIDKYEIDKKHGYDIKYVYNNNPGIIHTMFTKGEIDVSYVPPLTFAQYIQNGMDLKMIGPYTPAFVYYLANPNKDYNNLLDLKGRRFGTASKTTSSYSLTVLLMKSMGLELEKDYKIVFADFPNLNKFLLNGDIDFYTALEDPSTFKLIIDKKAKVVGTMEDLWREKHNRSLPFLVGTAKSEYLAKNPDVPKAMQLIYNDGVKYINENPDLWEKERSYFDKSTDEEFEMIKENYTKFIPTSVWGEKEVNDTKFLFEQAIKDGVIKEFNYQDRFIY